MIRKVCPLIIFVFLSVMTFAQVDIQRRESLTDNDLSLITALIREKVEDFQHCIDILSGKDYSNKEKKEMYYRALRLFIGEGERYPLAQPSYSGGYDTVWHNAVVMCSAPSKKQRKYELMKNYLSRLITNSESPSYRYKKVVIEGADIVFVSEFEAIGDHTYIATAHYLQSFTAYKSVNEEMAAYHDYTSKTVQVFVEFKELTQPDGSTKPSWIIKLGDVSSDDVW